MNSASNSSFGQGNSDERLRECELELLQERDRVIGLEQELLRYKTDQVNAELRMQIVDLEHSAEMKIGRFVLGPVKIGRIIALLPVRAVRRAKKVYSNRSSQTRISD